MQEALLERWLMVVSKHPNLVLCTLAKRSFRYFLFES